MKKLYNNIKLLINRIFDDEITVYSAQASFYIVISTFPFVMLLMSLIGFITPISVDSVINWINGLFPVAIRSTVISLASEVFEKSVSLISVSALTALWSASRGIASLERGVKRVYRTKPSKNPFANILMSIIYTFIFMALIFATLILQVFGNILTQWLNNYIHFSTTDVLLIRGVFSFALMTLFFQLMYYFFNNRQAKFNKNLPGAAFCAAGWIIFSNLYSIYIDNFANYSYIYGSLTAVVLLMLWLYFCVNIFLIGAELNKLIYKNMTKERG